MGDDSNDPQWPEPEWLDDAESVLVVSGYDGLASEGDLRVVSYRIADDLVFEVGIEWGGRPEVVPLYDVEVSVRAHFQDLTLRERQGIEAPVSGVRYAARSPGDLVEYLTKLSEHEDLVMVGYRALLEASKRRNN